MLSAGRRVCELDSYVKNGEWNAEIGKEHFGLDVHHSTIGIIGMGRVEKPLQNEQNSDLI